MSREEYQLRLKRLEYGFSLHGDRVRFIREVEELRRERLGNV